MKHPLLLFIMLLGISKLYAQISDTDFKGANSILIQTSEGPLEAYKSAASMFNNSDYSIIHTDESLLVLTAKGYYKMGQLIVNASIQQTDSCNYVKLRGAFDSGTEVEFYSVSTKLDGQIEHRGMKGSLIFEAWAAMNELIDNYPGSTKLYFSGSAKNEKRDKSEIDDIYH